MVKARRETAEVPQRRAALVEAAFRLMTQKGLEGLRLRDVAAEVGIDHSTLHHYFTTKQDLVEAVVDHATSQFWATTAPTGTAAKRLSLHLGMLRRMITERPELHVVLRELDLRALRDPEVRRIVAAREKGWSAALTALFREGEWAQDIDSRAAAELVIATVKGASLRPDTADKALRQLERLFVRSPARHD